MAAKALAAPRAAAAAAASAIPRRGLDRASPGFSTHGAGQLYEHTLHLCLLAFFKHSRFA